MANKPLFYERLSAHGKQCYNATEKIRPHTERFIQLMNQTEKSEGSSEHLFFTDEEIQYLGEEDLVTLTDLHETEGWIYMED